MKKYPTGLGLWVAFPTAAHKNNGWSWLAYECAKVGCKWLAIRSGQAGFEGGFPPLDRKAAAEACQTHGLECYTWHYSLPGTWRQEVDHVVACLDSGMSGHIIDAEAEWGFASKYAKEHGFSSMGVMENAAVEFCATVRSRVGDSYIAHAPLAWLAYHQDFPYKAFGEGTDQTMPQTYWTELKVGSYVDMARNCLTEWEKLWAADDPRAKKYAPIGVTYGRESLYAKTAPGFLKVPDLREFLDRYGNLEAISLYSVEAASKEAWQYLLDRQAARLAKQAKESEDAELGASGAVLECKP